MFFHIRVTIDCDRRAVYSNERNRLNLRVQYKNASRFLVQTMNKYETYYDDQQTGHQNETLKNNIISIIYIVECRTATSIIQLPLVLV